jgi:hypothetical protein
MESLLEPSATHRLFGARMVIFWHTNSSALPASEADFTVSVCAAVVYHRTGFVAGEKT